MISNPPSFELTNVAMSKAQKLTSIKGMNDILPFQSKQWLQLEARVHELMRRFSYENIRTPILEKTQLFVKGTGESTDIVEKEMYSFIDKLNGEDLTLRPENTPGVVRSAIEHNLTYDGGKRLYYMGQMFRHERPQRGRYRQFHQLGVESLGFAGADVDAEVITLAWQLFSELGLENIRVEINSLGVLCERQAHRIALIDYFKANASLLDEDAIRRLNSNPLRILDTKNPDMQSLVENAPKLLDFLGADSRARFEKLKNLLTACHIEWVVNPRLVRGLDYYNHTVFEFITNELGAQGTICGGGRYDGLFELLGGKPTHGVGWGLGIERLLDLLEQQGKVETLPSLNAYAIIPSEAAQKTALVVLQKLRGLGVSIQMHANGQDAISSMKSQFKKADSSSAQYALIFGEDELSRNSVMIKSLRDGDRAQIEASLEDLEVIAERLLQT